VSGDVARGSFLAASLAIWRERCVSVAFSRCFRGATAVFFFRGEPLFFAPREESLVFFFRKEPLGFGSSKTVAAAFPFAFAVASAFAFAFAFAFAIA